MMTTAESRLQVISKKTELAKYFTMLVENLSQLFYMKALFLIPVISINVWKKQKTKFNFFAFTLFFLIHKTS